MRYMQVYLDNLESAPVPEEAAEMMAKHFTQHYGQAGAYHQFGQWSKSAMEYFTESAAEILGMPKKPVRFSVGPVLPPVRDGKILVSPFEHPAVLREITRTGLETVEIPATGWRYDLNFVEKFARENPVAMVVVSAVERIAGTVEDITPIAKICVERQIPLLVDISAGVGRVENLQLPEGEGIYFYLRGRCIGAPADLTIGAAPDFDFPHPIAAGVHKSLQILFENLPEKIQRLRQLEEYFWELLQLHLPHLTLLGGSPRAAGILTIAFEDVDREALMLALDMQGVMFWAGENLSSPSRGFAAAGVPPEIAGSAVRFSLWHRNTQEEIDYVLRVLPPLVDRVRFEKGSDKFSA